MNSQHFTIFLSSREKRRPCFFMTGTHNNRNTLFLLLLLQVNHQTVPLVLSSIVRYHRFMSTSNPKPKVLRSVSVELLIWCHQNEVKCYV